MRKIIRVGTVVTALFASTMDAHAAMAGYKASDIIIRARAVQIQFHNHTNTAALSGVGADNKVIPEVDGAYFFTRNIAAELILTYPQTIYVHSGIGSLKALPPTLTAQYHFMPDSPYFRPYVGVGVNYTRFFSYSLVSGLSGSRSSLGAALQAGFDVPLTRSLTFNVDVKKVYMKTKITAPGGGSVGTLALNPLLIGVGLGWKF